MAWRNRIHTWKWIYEKKFMTKYLKFILIILVLNIPVYGQTKKELEEQRKKTQEEISYIDNLLKETERKRGININDLKILSNKIKLYEDIIEGLEKEIELVNERIEINRLAIYLLEKDLEILKKEYEKVILNAYRVSKGQNYMMFILSAKDFNQGYKRIKYLQEVNQYRRNTANQIYELKKEIEKIENKLNEDLIVVSNLKNNQEKQKNALLREQEKKKIMVNSLSSKERQLKKELDNKRRIAQRIENEIMRIIDEERKKNVKGTLTSEMKLISDNFELNKGRLPWPVEKGVITGNFGLQKHKELAFVTENNPGIEITSLGKVKVRSVFKGEVVRVLPISGANMSIIIKHGNYYTVYQNLINVVVKTGDVVETKQILGEVYCDEENNNKSILKFMIFKEKEKLDPEEWIAKSQ